MNGKVIRNWVVAGVIVVAVVVVALASFTSIPAGHTGVVTRFGAVSETVLPEGLHFKIPFVDSVIKMDNRVMKTEVSSTSASKDLQTVSLTVSLNYRVDKANSANIYRNIGPYYQDVLVNPAIQECIKAVTAKFTAEELITERQVISQQMMEALEEKIGPYGLDVEVFNIINFDFSDEFNAAIEAKQTAQQNALKAQQDLERVKVEAEQVVELAKAEAEAYKLKSEQLTEIMIQMEWINKWNGELPMVSSDGGYILDLSQLQEQAEK